VREEPSEAGAQSELDGFTIARQGFASVFGALFLAHQYATGTSPSGRFPKNPRAITSRVTAL
jgi:hypothetical protein